MYLQAKIKNPNIQQVEKKILLTLPGIELGSSQTRTAHRPSAIYKVYGPGSIPGIMEEIFLPLILIRKLKF